MFYRSSRSSQRYKGRSARPGCPITGHGTAEAW